MRGPDAGRVEFDDDAGFEHAAEVHRLRTMTISRAVDLWLGELERKNHSSRTIDTYRRLLDKLSDAFPYVDVDDISTSMVRQFLDDQAKAKQGGRRKSPATLAQNVSIIGGFFDWLTKEGVTTRNPVRRNGDRIIARPRPPRSDDNDNVVTISTEDVQKLLAAVEGWSETLALYCLAYLGPRRRALSQARYGDYNRDNRTIIFREKGGKTIAKPVPDELAVILESAIRAGIYDDDGSYLVPSRGRLHREERDDRLIWHLVRSVAERAGVKTHVHALRAAFAVHYLQTHKDENAILALKELMGHQRIETTLVYLRRLDRKESMETVRNLSWGINYPETPGGGSSIRLPAFVAPGSLLYFISDGPLSRRGASVKIGFTDDVDARLRALQTGYPHRLEVVAVIPDGSLVLEADIHALFKRERLEGEWFTASSRIQAFVAQFGYEWPLDPGRISEIGVDALPWTEKEGFEPSSLSDVLLERARSQHDADVPRIEA